jgi:hypothetical protein
MRHWFCDYFRLEYAGAVLQPVFGRCDAYDCEVVGWVLNPEWLDVWSALCGWGAW